MGMCWESGFTKLPPLPKGRQCSFGVAALTCSLPLRLRVSSKLCSAYLSHFYTHVGCFLQMDGLFSQTNNAHLRLHPGGKSHFCEKVCSVTWGGCRRGSCRPAHSPQWILINSQDDCTVSHPCPLYSVGSMNWLLIFWAAFLSVCVLSPAHFLPGFSTFWSSAGTFSFPPARI